jgi:hypothetical protein
MHLPVGHSQSPVLLRIHKSKGRNRNKSDGESQSPDANMTGLLENEIAFICQN